MDLTIATAVLSVAAAISGIFLGWAGRTRSLRQEIREEAGTGAALHTDVDYIKRGVDDIRLEQRAHGLKIDGLTERVTRVEESAKQAHKRIDRMDDTHTSD
jgi:hypothetical protein